MLHYVHQLVANHVCLLFGAEQVVYSEFLEPFHWKQQLWEQNSKTAETYYKAPWSRAECRQCWGSYFESIALQATITSHWK